jgi:ComF family protein
VSLALRLPLLLLRAGASLAVDALAPAGCAACDAPVPRRSIFCATCASTVVRDGGLSDGAAAFGLFGGALAIALRRLKFSNRPDLARPLGDLARRAAHDEGLEGDVVVPVPLHGRRLAERGYNQAVLLGAAAAVELRAPLAARALERVRNTFQQARLDRAARLENVGSAFRVRDPTAVRARRVVLVDDVATTGATIEACRAPLLAAGASSVIALVIARAARGAAARAEDEGPIMADEARA